MFVISVAFQIPWLLEHCSQPRLYISTPSHRACPTCEMPFKLCFKGGHYRWIGARYESQGCQECLDQQPQVRTIGFLSNVKQHMWMPKLEAFMMWIFEYPRQQIFRELHPADHKRVDAWTQSFQQTLSAWYQLQLNEGFDGPLFRRLHRASTTALPAT